MALFTFAAVSAASTSAENLINSNLQKPLKPRSDHIKGKIKYQYHDSDETGNRVYFPVRTLSIFSLLILSLLSFWL